jgi:hypothetical protein
MAVNPTNVGLMLGLGLVAMFAVGFALFSAGLSEDSIAIGGFVVFIGLMGLGGGSTTDRSVGRGWRRQTRS